jgi:hypothetical protein
MPQVMKLQIIAYNLYTFSPEIMPVTPLDKIGFNPRKDNF